MVSFKCREGCGACCIEPSITTGFYGMEQGKPAGVPCVHLDMNYLCKLFGKPERPGFCGTLPPSFEMCGNDRQDASIYLVNLEQLTKP